MTRGDVVLGPRVRFLSLGALAGLVLAAGAARACPVCGSDAGREVRAGLARGLPPDAALALLPFPAAGGLVLLIRYGPWGRPPRPEGG